MPLELQKVGKKEGKIKADEKCKGLLDRFVVIVGCTGEPTEESAASSTQVGFVHQRLRDFVKMTLT